MLGDTRGNYSRGRDARLARLHHTTDERPGITRYKARSGFDYRRPDGSLVRDLETLQRIKSLATERSSYSVERDIHDRNVELHYGKAEAHCRQSQRWRCPGR